MPIYEFKCNDCSKVFSELRKIGDFNNCKCPFCESDNTVKKMSSFSSPGISYAKGCSPAGGGG